MKKFGSKIDLKLRLLLPLAGAFFILILTFSFSQYLLHRERMDEALDQSIDALNSSWDNALQTRIDLLEALAASTSTELEVRNRTGDLSSEMTAAFARSHLHRLRRVAPITGLSLYDSSGQLLRRMPSEHGLSPEHLSPLFPPFGQKLGPDPGLMRSTDGQLTIQATDVIRRGGGISGFVMLEVSVDSLLHQLVQQVGNPVYLVPMDDAHHPVPGGARLVIERTEEGTSRYNSEMIADLAATVLATHVAFTNDDDLASEHGALDQNALIFDRFIEVRQPLFGVNGEHVAELILLWDTSMYQDKFMTGVIRETIVSLIVGILLFILFAFILTRTESMIATYQENIFSATRERAREHKQHADTLKKERAALRDTVSFFKTLIDTIPSPVFAKDTEGNYILFNRAFSEGILRMPPDEIMGRSVMELRDKVPERDAREYHRRDVELLQQGGTQSYEHTMVRPDGSERTFRFFKSVFSTTGNEAAGIVGVMMDITASRHAQSALEEQRDFLRHVIESLPYPFKVIDVEAKKVEIANLAATESGELGCDECTERHLGHDSKGGVSCPLEQVQATGGPVVLEHTHVDDKGHIRYVEVNAYPIRDESGRITQIIEYSIDQTERRQGERARDLLYRIAEEFLDDRPLADQCNDACSIIGDVLSLPTVAIERADFSRGEMVFIGVSESSETLQSGLRIPMNETISGTVALSDEAVFLDVSRDRSDYSSAVLRSLDVEAFGCVPIRFDNRVIGTLGVGDPRRREFSDLTRHTLVLVADILAQVLARQDAMDRVRNSEHFLDTVLTTIPSPIWVVGPDGRIEVANDALCRLIGMERAALTGILLDDLPESSALRSCLAAEDLIRSNGAVESREVVLTDAQGKNRTFVMQQQTIRWASDDFAVIGVLTDITENRRLLEETRNSQSVLSEAQRVAGIGSWVANLQTGEFSYSEQLITFMGRRFRDEKLTPEKLMEYIHPDDRERLVQVFEGPAIERGTVDFEYRMIRADGEQRIMSLHARLYRDSSGKPLRWIGTVMDITERRETQERMEMLAQFPEHNPEIVATFDHHARIQYLNPAGMSVLSKLGRSLEEVNDLLPDEFDELVSAILCSQQPVRNVRSHCDNRTWQWNLHPVAGQSIIHGYATDVTERTKFESTARKLSAAVRQSGNLIYITDTKGVIEYINPQLSECTGYSAVELLGQTPSIFAAGRESDDAYRELWETILSGRRWSGTIQNRKKSGETYWERKVISPITDENGRITHFVSVGEDISQEMLAQQKLAETDKLSAIGVLAAGVAHEFKNYLGGVIGNASLALEELHDDDGIDLAADALSSIIDLGERANEVAMSLLTYSRNDVNDRHPTDLRRVLKNAVSMVEKELRNQSIELVTYYEDVPEVPAAASKIQQVVLNLLINAQQSIESDGIISIGLLHRGANVIIKVGDSGTGIRQEDLGRIFDPFFSTKGVWGKSSVSGTGLGLSISRNIAREHGGELSVDSIHGVGSTFVLTLPVHESATEYGDGESSGFRRIGVFTLDEEVRRKYVNEGSADDRAIYLVDSVDEFQQMIESDIELIILDARFAAKMELYMVSSLCERAMVPYAVIKNSASEYQLEEILEHARAVFAGVPPLSHVSDVTSMGSSRDPVSDT